MNIIFAGPCGVGKSTIGLSYANRKGIEFIDFDEYRAVEMEKARPNNSACSVTHLDLRKCLPSLLDAISKNFLLDIGGDTVFRPITDNEDRKNQILWLKINYSARLVLLTAKRDILFQRFSTSKDRNRRCANELIAKFDELWNNWLSIGEPYWSECADLQIDVSPQSIKDSISQIEQGLNDNGISSS
jgi:shikimate kinase